MTQPLPPQYDPKTFEADLYSTWEERGYFGAAPADAATRDPYVIVIPPPNVTSVLHMGHGLNNTIQDVLVRWRRMQGRLALWVPGTDHAGIATQNVVERQLADEGKSRHEVGREAFEARVWDWVGQTGPRILGQLKAIGASCDWTRTAFTLDEGLSRAVREVFVRLHEKGLVYRGRYIINWCPRCLTALSNEEAEAHDTDGHLWHLRYPFPAGTDAPGLPTLADGRPYLVVATTRPETMLGDTAVAVHPADGRYAAVVGAEVELPLTGRRIPVVGDEWADPEFGSGAVKVTPAHDPNDFDVGQRHGLEALEVLTEAGVTNDNAPEEFRGLDRFEARDRVVSALREQGLLDAVEDHAHSVPRCYRCGTVVEPRLSLQWFVRMKPLAEPALAASREGRVRFTPARWKKVYEHWLENIRDWCISRQLWWGHRIPVWYCACGEMVVARQDPDACPACGSAELEQDADVLDTWFSSWLWPFSTLGWPDDTDDLRAFYPTHTLSTAPEILFFWVARMIMAGLEFMGEEPFSDVYLHATVRDQLGRKMSKSLGNGIDPLEVVELYGADALRYTVVAAAGVGTDVQLNPDDLEGSFSPGRNFANKLWNMGRFALMNLAERDIRPLEEARGDLELADRWILSRLAEASAEATRNLEEFRFHDYASTTYHFLWGEVADWYIELIKPRLDDEAEGASRAAALATLVHVLDAGLRLLHPIMPFVTEALWLNLPLPAGDRPESLVVAPWPEREPRDTDAEEQLGALIELIGSIRTARAEYNVPPSQPVAVHLTDASAGLRAALEGEPRALARLARAEPADGGLSGAGAHDVLKDGTGVFVPLADVIDLGRERSRLSAELERIGGQRRAAEGRLANESFTGRAPADVVEREREKAVSFREQEERLSEKLQALG
ncbi:MAG: valine--tRNA ligase [Gemmatimonadota bacterium]